MCGLRNSSKLDKISIFLRLFVSPDFLQKIWSTSMEELIHFCKSFSQVVRNTVRSSAYSKHFNDMFLIFRPSMLKSFMSISYIIYLSHDFLRNH
uniref:Uncharacterized protein n=1 Tax=Lepeophtheirus salmonis TaxID=72036 RepID=A0A0K2TI04_LEPSM